MTRKLYFFDWIRCVLLLGAMVLAFPVGGAAQQESGGPLYTDILTSKMNKTSEKEVADTQLKELQRIQRASDHTQAKIRNAINLICLMFLFGAFSAIWAQNTARNPLLWFLMGACFSFVTILVILRKNARGRRHRRYRRKGAAYFDYAQF